MDADVFSQPIGYIPKFPLPPKYIKVRARDKKEKDFDRIFLAQELDGQPGKVENGGSTNGASTASLNGSVHGSKKDTKSIWAMEFSKDGKYLAVGGQDKIVRVWAVISTHEERAAHEKDEDAAGGPNAQGARLSAPVFRSKPIMEYVGHTSDVLDLSWSKVLHLHSDI
jgi:WD repeat-containing protein 44